MRAAPQPATAPKHRRSSWLTLLLFVAFLGSCTVIQGVFQFTLPRKPVGATIPAEFLILVVTPAKEGKEAPAQIVFYKDLPSFQQQNPDYSFLFPPGEEDRLWEQIQRGRPVRWSADRTFDVERPFSASFSVKPLPNGRQAFEVNYAPYDDLHYRSWYEATDKQIFPQSHYQFAGMSPGAILSTLGAMLLTTVLWGTGFLVYLAYKFFRGRRRRASPGT